MAGTERTFANSFQSTTLLQVRSKMNHSEESHSYVLRLTSHVSRLTSSNAAKQRHLGLGLARCICLTFLAFHAPRVASLADFFSILLG